MVWYLDAAEISSAVDLSNKVRAALGPSSEKGTISDLSILVILDNIDMLLSKESVDLEN